MQRLKDAGVDPREERAKPAELQLAGEEFVITGTLQGFPRTEAEARIKALGGAVKSEVTRKTAYLIVGAEPGSKLARARALGSKQIDEDEFLRILNRKA